MFLKTKNEAKHILAEVVGWYGVVAIVASYGLLVMGWMSLESLWYAVLNATGALGLMVISAHLKDYQSSLLNLMWLIIALVGLFKIFL